MKRSVHIVAVGARTPVGLLAKSSAAAVRAGISRLKGHPFMVDARGNLLGGAIDARLDPKLLGWQRLIPLAAGALDEVTANLFQTGVNPGLSVLLALPEVRPGFSDQDASQVARALPGAGRSQEAAVKVEIAGRGHAGALYGLKVACERIAQGQAELCLVGGVDSYFETDTIDWLEANRQLAGEGVRGGFSPGEGAAFLALADRSASRRLGLQPLATLRAVGTSTETRLIKHGDDVLGEGLSSAVGEAIADLRLPDEAVDAVYCDINGERYRTEEWAFAMLRLEGALRDTAYEAPADRWGDVGAASGALGCVLAVQAWARGYARGPRALVWASSEGGLRGAALLEQAAGLA